MLIEPKNDCSRFYVYLCTDNYSPVHRLHPSWYPRIVLIINNENNKNRQHNP